MTSKELLDDENPIGPWLAIILFGLIAIMLLGSCVPNKEIRRAKKAAKATEKLAQKYPELARIDTIRDTLVVYTPSVEIDTVVAKSDTIRLQKGKARAQIITKGDSLRVNFECVTDTLYIPVATPCRTINPTRTLFVDRPLNWWEQMIRSGGNLALLIILVMAALWLVREWMAKE